MKREIKFRGKASRKDKDMWLYGDLIKIGNSYHILGKDDMREDGHHITQDSDIPTWVDKETIGQFTGLYDKDNREIYEGDIMGLPERDAKGVAYKNRYVRVVEWINDGFFLLDHCVMGGEVRKYGDRLALEISLNSNYAGMVRCFSERGLDYTVIGNIYDNPELLKGGAE